MAYPRTIRNFNAFIDGVSYFGKSTEATLPKLNLQTEDHRGAGMDAPIAIDMGVQGMTADVSFAEWSPELCRLFGTRQNLVLRPGALGESDVTADTYIFTIGGRWSGWEGSTLKPGGSVPLKLTTSVHYFRAEFNGEELFEIDIENGKRIINGVDQLADLRKAMGL